MPAGQHRGEPREARRARLAPSGLRAELQRLESILMTAEPLSTLARLADPARLDFLLQVQLGSILRRGPDGELTPCRLLAVAQQAAATGLLPLASPGTLRRLLGNLGSRLREAGAWDSQQPMWWDPLPAPIREEQLWSKHRLLEKGLPPRQQLDAAFADACEAPRWLVLPHLLPAELTTMLHRQLETADRAGHLALERAGVGAGQHLSSRRSDSVRYLSGLEPDLLRATPALAALVQWCLTRLGPRLAPQLPGRRVFPPQQAMLARYPAPSGGYHPHLDNPGGDDDNGRTLTLVIYLNPPAGECQGGEIALWAPKSSTTATPASVTPARSGSAVLFDARSIAHRVQPLSEGPARWALTLWLNDAPQQPPPAPPVPNLTVTELLLPIETPRLPVETLLFHELDDRTPTGKIVVSRARRAKRRVGTVTTVYRGGRGLDAWCAHHLALGIDHLLLVFDHLDEPREAADAARLRERFGPHRLTVWSGAEVASRRWQHLSDTDELVRFARSGASNHAVAARQTLNASAALQAARGEELGGAPLDWLLHLDADELFYPEGSARGGGSLEEHFAAVSDAGWHLVRYLNHELFQTRRPDATPRFKRNPRWAAAHLGPVGWSKLSAYLRMAQTDPRPYFTGYFNGKSAVAVKAGRCAAGVHGWTLSKPSRAVSRLLAGPSILHFHFASAAAFRRKYLAVASATHPDAPLPFQPSPVEVATLDRIRKLRDSGADDATLHRSLDDLHARMTIFSDADEEVLEAAHLLFTPGLDHLLPTGP